LKPSCGTRALRRDDTSTESSSLAHALLKRRVEAFETKLNQERERGEIMNTKILLAVLAIGTLAGCAHGNMRGSVAMKASEDEAHVCLGDNEVKPGDKVALFSSVCAARGRAQESGPACEKKYLGDGQVTRILNQHYSVIKVAQGVKFDEGTIVEKQ
jgi:hypothetical protein